MIKILLENNYKPKGETKEHYELKQIAKYILRTQGYTMIADEVTTGYDKYLHDNDTFNNHKYSKSIIDIIGLNMSGTFMDKRKPPKFKTWGIECKISLADFKNGFNTSCEKTSIITPKGIIPIELIPPKIGFIEVDLDNYKICDQRGFYIKEGINEIIKPRIRYDKFTGKDKEETKENHQDWCKEMMHEMLVRHSNVMMWKRQEINIEVEKTRGRKKGRR